MIRFQFKEFPNVVANTTWHAPWTIMCYTKRKTNETQVPNLGYNDIK
jgi:hypothetical protein